MPPARPPRRRRARASLRPRAASRTHSARAAPPRRSASPSPRAVERPRQIARASSTWMSSNPQSSPGGLRAPLGVARILRQRTRGSFPGRRRSGTRSPPASSGCGRPGPAITQASIGFPVAPARRRARRCRRRSPPASPPTAAASTGVIDDEQRVGLRRRSSGDLDRLAVFSPGRPTPPCRRDCRRSPPAGRNAPSRARVSAENGGTVRPARFAGVDGENAGSAGVGDDRDAAARRAAAARRGTPRCRTSRRSSRRG